MKSVDAGGRQGRDFQPERATGKTNVFETAVAHIEALQAAKKRVVVASWSAGSSERMGGVLSDHGLAAIRAVAHWSDAAKLHDDAVGIAVLGLERGFEAPDFAVISEQDILGDRMVRGRDAGAAGAEFPHRSLGAGAGRPRHAYRARRRPLSGPENHRRAGRAA